MRLGPRLGIVSNMPLVKSGKNQKKIQVRLIMPFPPCDGAKVQVSGLWLIKIYSTPSGHGSSVSKRRVSKLQK